MKLLLGLLALTLSGCIFVADDPYVPPYADVGDSCFSDADCWTGWCRYHNHYTNDPDWWTFFPGGLCTLPCDSSYDCGPGGLCTDAFGEPTPYCVQRCNTDLECRPEWECEYFGFYGDQACWPSEPYRPQH